MKKKVKNFTKVLIYNLLKLLSFKKIREKAKLELLAINYHSILGIDADPKINKNTYRSEEELERDIIFLKKHYHFIKLSELIKNKLQGKKLPSNSVFLTFDDGLAVVYHKIRPILLKHNVSAAFFLNPLFVDNKDLHYQRKKNLIAQSVSAIEVDAKQSMWKAIFAAHGMEADDFFVALNSIAYNMSPMLDELAILFNIDVKQYLTENQIYLSSQQVEQMIHEGFWFGGHSMDHPKYDEISFSEQINQTLDSINWVKKRFGLSYAIFAFPLRDHNMSMQLFEEINQKSELTFGVMGMGNDIIPSHIQRIDVESSGVPMNLALKFEYIKYIVQGLVGRKQYVRPEKYETQL